MTEWPARIGKPDAFGYPVVLCGRPVRGVPRCDGVIGRAEPILGDWDGPGGWSFGLETGWFPGADGVYRMGKRARERVAQGRKPLLRRGYFSPKVDSDLLPAGSPQPPIEEPGRAPTFPVRVRCPQCMTVSVVDERTGLRPPRPWAVLP